MSREDLENKFARLRASHDEHRRLREEMHRKRAEILRGREEERARRSGRRPLDVQRIATVAVAIADAQGLDEVSMRKVAAALGAGTMSLYHYVKTKEDLFAAMEDIIMGEIVVPDRDLKGNWRDRIETIARHTRDAYRRHPWALMLHSKSPPGLNGVRHVEQSMAVLAETGLGFEERMAINIVLDDFVFGHALRVYRQIMERDGGTEEEVLERIGTFMTTHLASGHFPELSRVAADTEPVELVRRLSAMMRPDEWFEIGLDALLDGLARHYGVAS